MHFKKILWIIAALMLVSSVTASAPWWDSSWEYRMQIVITNNDAEDYLDLPLNVTAHDDAGIYVAPGSNAQSDCGDYRIVCNGVEVDFGIDSCSSGNGYITWQQDLAASSSVDYCFLYYGNSGASATNVTWNDARYNIWTDFSSEPVWGIEIDPTAHIDVVGGVLDYTNIMSKTEAYYYVNQSYLTNYSHFAWEVKYNFNPIGDTWDGGTHAQMTLGTMNTGEGVAYMQFCYPPSTRCKYLYLANYTQPNQATLYDSGTKYTYPYPRWTRFTYRNGTFVGQLYTDAARTSLLEQLSRTYDTDTFKDFQYFNIYSSWGDWSGAGNYQCDNECSTDDVYFWKVTSTDSSVTFAMGTEEEYVPTPTIVNPNGGELYLIGNSIDINFSESAGTGAITYDLDYSSNNGSSWNQIVQNHSGVVTNGTGWWDTDWVYRKEMTLSNSSHTLEPIVIDVTELCEGNCQADFEDIRVRDVTDNLTLDYEFLNASFGHTYGTAQTPSYIQFIAPDASHTYHLYYNNAGASGVDTKIFNYTFTFTDGLQTLTGTGHSQSCGSYYIDDGLDTCSRYSATSSQYVNYPYSSGRYISGYWYDTDTADSSYNNALRWTDLTRNHFWGYSSNDAGGASQTFHTATPWYTLGVRSVGWSVGKFVTTYDSHIDVYVDHVLEANATTYIVQGPPTYIASNAGSSSPFYIDNWRSSDTDFNQYLTPNVPVLGAQSSSAGRSYPWDTTGLTEGNEYLVRVRAESEYLSTSYDESDAVFGLDAGAPVVTITGPTQDTYMQSLPLNLETAYTVGDLFLDSCWYTLDGSDNINMSCTSSVLVEGYCYQESANESTACGGLDTGNWDAPSNGGSSWYYGGGRLFDGIWTNEDGVTPTGGIVYAYVNYTKPAGATNESLWRHRPHVSNDPDGGNSTIPQACWSALPDQLNFRITSAGSGGAWHCWNGASWTLIYQQSSAARNVNEEGMWWFISGFAPGTNSTEVVIPVNNYGNHIIEVFANDTLGNSASDTFEFGLGNVDSTLSDYTYADSSFPVSINFNVGGIRQTTDFDGVYCDADWSGSYPCTNAYDGDTSTWAEAEAGQTDAHMYINYTVPKNAVNVQWEVLDSSLQNITPSAACLEQTPLQLRATGYDIVVDMIYYCWSGSTWSYLGEASSGEKLYEQKILWEYPDNRTADCSIIDNHDNITCTSDSGLSPASSTCTSVGDIDESVSFYASCTSESGYVYNESASSIIIDTIAPTTLIQAPVNYSSYVSLTLPYELDLNFNAADTNLDSCWYIVDGGNWTYQEDANATTAPNLLSDGDWSTSVTCVGDCSTSWYMNYTKVANANPESLWQIKGSFHGLEYVRQNLTISENCWAQDTLQFRVTSARSTSTVTSWNNWACWDGSTWETLLQHAYSGYSNSIVYEEAMWWQYNGISLPSCNNATFDTSTYGNHYVTVYANDTAGNIGSNENYYGVAYLDTNLSSYSGIDTEVFLGVTYDVGGDQSVCTVVTNTTAVNCTAVQEDSIAAVPCEALSGVQEQVAWYAECNSTVSPYYNYYTPTYYVYADSVDPIITQNEFTFGNNSAYFQKNLTGNFSWINSNLFLLNATVDGDVIYSETDINSTTYSWELNYDPSNLAMGEHELKLVMWDAHTKEEIPEFKVKKAMLDTKVEFDTGTATVEIEAVDDTGIINQFEVAKERNRYTFDLKLSQATKNKAQDKLVDTKDKMNNKDKNKKEKDKDKEDKKLDKLEEKMLKNPDKYASLNYEYTFVVTSDEPIYIIERPQYKWDTWLVTGKSWVDFYIPEEATEVIMQKLDDYNVEVTLFVEEDKEKLTFESVGLLNNVTTIYTFYTYNATLYWDEPIIEGQRQYPQLKIDLGDLPYSSYDSAFSYYGDPRTVVEQSSNSSELWLNTSFITPLVSNTTVKESTWYFNLTDNASVLNEHVLPFNQTVYNIGIDDCTNASYTRSLTFCGKDEVTDANVSLGLDVTLELWVDDPDYTVNVSFDFPNNQTCHSICIFPDTVSYQTYAIMEYGSYSDYDDRKYYLFNTTIDATERFVDLYHLNDTILHYSEVLLSVVDQSSGEPVEDAYIKILRYYPGDNTYKVIEVEKSDLNGQTIAKMVLYDVFYKFLVEYPAGTVALETPVDKMTSNVITFPLALTDPVLAGWETRTNTNGDVRCNDETFTCSFIWSDSTGTVVDGTLYIYENTGLTRNLIYEQTTTAAAGQISYTIPDGQNNTRYDAEGYIEMPNTAFLLDTATLFNQVNPFTTSPDLRIASLIPLILLTIAITAALLDIGAVGVIIGSLSGIIIGMATTIIPVNIPGLISLVVLAFVLIFKLWRG